jgi:OOP family OmpA-OmpF porin
VRGAATRVLFLRFAFIGLSHGSVNTDSPAVFVNVLMVSKTKAAAIALAWTLAAPAAAVDPGWYGFGSFTRTSFEVETPGGAKASFSGGDDKDNGTKLGAGYMFTRWFGVEAGWVDFGKAKPGVAAVGLSAERDGEVRANGPFFAGVLALPVSERLSAFGKLGIVDARVNAQPDAGIIAGFLDAAADRRPMVGIGGAWQLNRNWAIQTEYEKYSRTGDGARPRDVKVDMVSIGMLFRFG